MMRIRTLFLACLLALGTTISAQTTLNFTVVQNALPQADYNSKILPDSLSFAFTDSSFGNIIGRIWRFGDGDSAIGNLTYVEHTYATKGVYEVCLEILDLQNCRDETCQDANHFVGINAPDRLVQEFHIAPNPYEEQATLYYSLLKPAHVIIESYNLAGAKQATLVNERQGQGQHTVLIGPSNGSEPGVQFIRLTVEGNTYMKKVVELR